MRKRITADEHELLDAADIEKLRNEYQSDPSTGITINNKTITISGTLKAIRSIERKIQDKVL